MLSVSIRVFDTISAAPVPRNATASDAIVWSDAASTRAKQNRTEA
jgi:hypothetical protein